MTRRKPDEPKTGYIIVPLVLRRDDDHVYKVENSRDWKTLYQTIAALRSHDENYAITLECAAKDRPPSKGTGSRTTQTAKSTFRWMPHRKSPKQSAGASAPPCWTVAGRRSTGRPGPRDRRQLPGDPEPTEGSARNRLRRAQPHRRRRQRLPAGIHRGIDTAKTVQMLAQHQDQRADLPSAVRHRLRGTPRDARDQGARDRRGGAPETQGKRRNRETRRPVRTRRETRPRHTDRPTAARAFCATCTGHSSGTPSRTTRRRTGGSRTRRPNWSTGCLPKPI